MINCSRNHLNRVAPFTLLQHRVASSDLHLLIISCVVLVAVCIVAGCVVVRLHAAYRKRLAARPEAEKLDPVRRDTRLAQHTPTGRLARLGTTSEVALDICKNIVAGGDQLERGG